jgi:hypothetical protein
MANPASLTDVPAKRESRVGKRPIAVPSGGSDTV